MNTPASNSLSAKKLAALHLGAVVFSERREYFKAKELCEFYGLAGIMMDDEGANEILLALAEQGLMREIGPGVYAKTGSVSEHPVFADDQNEKLAAILRDMPKPKGDFDV